MYIQEDKDNEKVKNRIHDTDLFIKEHKEYLKQQIDKSRKGKADFEAVAGVWAKLKAAYMAQRNPLEADEDFQEIVADGSKTKTGMVKSMKKIVKGKQLSKSWEPHAEGYTPAKDEFGDIFDTIAKATQDLPRIAGEIRATVELPKRQLPLIQEYQDLVSKADGIVAAAEVEKRQTEWSAYVEAVDAENADKAQRKKSPTRFHEAVNHYKDIRSKVAPLVGAKKKGNCSVM